ncbi:MAG TPA: hypothetical protein VF534_01660 [Paraburkholderia sp.]
MTDPAKPHLTDLTVVAALTAQIETLQASLKDANTENDRLAGIVSRFIDPDAVKTHGPARIDGGLLFGMEGGAAQVFAAALSDQFRDIGAVNYIEMRFQSDDSQIGELLVTMQRVDGKTPHALRLEAERERDHWRANHEHQVSRARFLIERGDIPLERVRAYTEMGALHELEEAIRHDREIFAGTSDEMNPTGQLVTKALDNLATMRKA